MADSIAPDNRQRNSEIMDRYFKGQSYDKIAVAMRISRNVVAGVVNRAMNPRDGRSKYHVRSPGIKIDLTGEKFGRLSVVAQAANAPTGEARWLCICDCGGTTTTRGQFLRNGTTQSCGCLQKDRAAESIRERRSNKEVAA